MTTLQEIQATLPDYAKDIKLNLSSLLNINEHLTAQQQWGTFLACAMMIKNKLLLQATLQAATKNLSPEAILAAKSAASIMAMTNVYYRFTHLVSNDTYQKMQANLRMSVIAQPGIDKLDFELYCLAVSAINGCGKCMDAHEKVLLEKGMSATTVQAAVKIAAVLYAVAMILEVAEPLSL